MLIEDTNSPRGPAEYNLSQNSSARSSPGNSDSTGQHLGPSLLDKSHGNHEVVNSDKPKNIASSKSPVSTILYYWNGTGYFIFTWLASRKKTNWHKYAFRYHNSD